MFKRITIQSYSILPPITHSQLRSIGESNIKSKNPACGNTHRIDVGLGEKKPIVLKEHIRELASASKSKNPTCGNTHRIEVGQDEKKKSIEEQFRELDKKSEERCKILIWLIFCFFIMIQGHIFLRI